MQTQALIEALAADIERDFHHGDKTGASYATPGQKSPAVHVAFIYSKGPTQGTRHRGFYLSVCPYNTERYLIAESARMLASPAEITRVSKKAERDARANLTTDNLHGLLERVLAPTNP